MKHALLTLLLLVVLAPAYSQTKSTKEISGTITYLNEPLKDVNITIKGTKKGTKTDDKGNYKIQANIGDQIQYSYVGFDTVTILIEDVTSILNIEMDNYVTKLDEVVVEGTSKTKKSSPGDEYNRKIKTSHGNINPMLLPDSRYFSRDRIATQYRTLSEALKFYYPYPIYLDFITEFEVDGKIYDFEPYVKMSTIQDIYVATIRSHKYPSPIQIMIIRTTNSEEYREITAEKHRNQNYYEDDAIVSDETETFSSNNLIKTISGKVTHLFAPIPNVNIKIKGTSKGTKTDDKGDYSLQVTIGDIIEYSHVAFQKVAVVIEDITSTLNIELQEKDNKLDEVVVKTRINQKALEYEKNRNRIIQTAIGEINLKAIGFSIDYSAGKDLPRHCDGAPGGASPLACAAGQKFPFLNRFGASKPPLWDVDGMISESAPHISVGLVEHMWYLSNAPASYGSKTVIIVQTISGTLNAEQEKKDIAAQYQNQNYYNADAVPTNSESTFSSSNLTKDISGKVTHLFAPIPNVNITIKGTSKGTKTDDKGEYSLEANIGDILEYSHVSYTTVAVMIEDVTATLNIELQEKDNKLDEVLVKAKKQQTSSSITEEKLNTKFKTAVGTIDPRASGFDIKYIQGKDLNPGAPSLTTALDGKFAGVFQCGPNMCIRGIPAIWDVDGQIFYPKDPPPAINVSSVMEVYILKGRTARYGGKSAIVVKTTSNVLGIAEAKKEEIAEQYRNQNYYNADAVVTTNASTFSSDNLKKNISGKVTHLFAPIPNVNITIKGTSKGTKTDSKGEYSLQANIGDVLEYSHVSYTTVAVMVEDITATLNIELQEKENKLDEVVVKARVDKKALEFEKRQDVNLQTPFGILNPRKSGFAINHLPGEEISDGTPSLAYALGGKFAGLSLAGIYPDEKLLVRGGPATYVIDGMTYDDQPPIPLSSIRDIFVLKQKAMVIIVTDTSPQAIESKTEEIAKQYRNQNYYNADAVSTNSESTFSSSNLTKDISGKVTHLFAPIPNVNITIKGTSKGTKTDDKGVYSLQANVGDILEYSHVSYTTVAIMVEDVTATLNIELQEKDNKLDEVVVKARKNQKALEYQKNRTRTIKTAVGEINLQALGFAFDYSAGEDLPKHCDGVGGDTRPLECAAAQQFPFINRFSSDKPPIWDIDGMIMDRPPFISISNVSHIWFLSNAPARYGNKKVFIVQTISGAMDVEKKEEIAKQYQNQNYYNADAITSNDNTTFSSANITTSHPKFIVTKDIRGKVTYLDAPMPLVNISVVGKNSGVITSPNGSYTIKANVGDIIQYSHVGFATVSIVVEDVTEVLDIEMVEQQNELETVVITTDGKLGKTAELAKKADGKFKTAMGTIDPKTAGYSVGYIDGDNTTTGARDILDMLSGKVAGVTVDRVNMIVKLRSTGSINTDVPAIFDVDGVIMNNIPVVDPINIKDIHVLKSLASTTRYGTAGRGGVIVVTTKSGDFSAAESNRNKIADKYTNKDFYANDASQISLASLNANSYADGLEAFSTKQKAYIYYDEKLKNQLPSYVDHIAIAQKFVSHFNDLTLSTQIFKELIERNNKNPEILKAIAFHLQTIGRPKEAIDAYEHTFKLRPQYAQSYRDLSNAYMENDQFKKSWRLYMSYLMQGNDVSSEGIGELIYNEMEWLYFSRRNQTDIKENFVPKSENLFDFRNDVRIVVEWNSSEAEFDLEFVNPDLRSYVFEHSLASNQELITDEKQKGYSSKEFFIDDLKDGEWLVNITYKGNKKPEPTYFKVTKFYNWGKSTQTKEIAVYKFQNERDKIQLMNFNKALLVAKN